MLKPLLLRGLANDNYIHPITLICFIIGVAFSFYWLHLPSLPPLLFIVLFLILSIIVVGRIGNNDIKQKKQALILSTLWAALFFAIGFTTAVWRADYRLADTIPDNLLGKNVTLEGTVINLSPARYNSTQFEFKIETLQTADQTLHLDLVARLRDYHHKKPPLKSLKNGVRLRFDAKLRKPTAFFNPHNFDYAAYLFAKNIRLLGYVRQRDTLHVLSTPHSTPRQLLRQRLLAKKDINYATLLALTIGDKQSMTSTQLDTLRTTGTAHLMSISGTHIGFVFLFVSLIMHWLWRRFPSLLLRLPAPKAAMLLALPFAFAYALLAGFTVPTQRSFYMLLLSVLLFIYGRQMSATTILLLVMTGVVIIDPWALISAGFWLSFGLTAVVIAVHYQQSGTLNNTTKRLSFAKQLLIMQCYLSLLAMPMTLWFFNQASIISPVANFFAVPWVGSVVLPLSFFGMLTDIWQPADWALIVLWKYLDFLAQWSFAAWSPTQAPLWVFIIAIAGTGLFLMPTGTPMRWLGLLPIVVLLVWQNKAIDIGAIKAVALDAGQGTAIALQTTNSTQVYDTGPPVGGLLLRQFLRSEGVSKINRLLISHDDFDHRGGVNALTAFYPNTKTMASNGDWQCVKGLNWQYDNVRFSVLHPPPSFSSTDSKNSDNDNSCVVRIETSNGLSMLLTGDISSDVENLLATTIKPVDVLFIAHHGSRYSTSDAFLDATRPSIAVITVGNNRYGHPHPSVIKKLQQRGITIYRTDTMGAVQLDLNHIINIKTTRQQALRYWHL